MVFGEPHLVKNGIGPPPIGDQAGQIQVWFRMDMAEFLPPPGCGYLFPPTVRIQVEFLEPGFMPLEQVLGIEKIDGIVRGQCKNNGRPAGPGKVGETFPKPF